MAYLAKNEIITHIPMWMYFFYFLPGAWNGENDASSFSNIWIFQYIGGLCTCMHTQRAVVIWLLVLAGFELGSKGIID